MAAYKRFNPLDILFRDAAFRLSFKEKNPRCADCTHVQELIFSEHYYNWLKKNVCVSCEKAKEDAQNECCK